MCHSRLLLYFGRRTHGMPRGLTGGAVALVCILGTGWDVWWRDFEWDSMHSGSGDAQWAGMAGTA